jgi:dolichyl-phosphate-mannose-protein mannosyltransferase
VAIVFTPDCLIEFRRNRDWLHAARVITRGFEYHSSTSGGIKVDSVRIAPTFTAGRSTWNEFTRTPHHEIMAAQHSPTNKSTPALSRGELMLALGLVLLGAGLRFAYPSWMAVEHFDEGVYASNIFFDAESGYRYPNRHLYAPPLVPFAEECSIILFGSNGIGPLLPGLLFGTATIALCWWVARSWFGVEAGLAAASLAALSDQHIVYSRTCLTDVPLAFWLLLATHLAWRAFVTPNRHSILAAGLATGLAWWTKYNGWLPLAIALSGGAGWYVQWRPPRQEVIRKLLIWCAIAAISAVVWSPVWFGLNDYGGYASVAANHRGYLVGFEGWFNSFTRQLGNLQHFDGGLTAVSIAVAVLIPVVAARTIQKRSTWNADARWVTATRPLWVAILGVAIVVAPVGFGSPFLFALAAVAGIIVALRSTTRPDNKHENVAREKSLALWFLAAWFVGLFFATPFYTPYPRLILPWLMAGWLGTAAAIGGGLDRIRANVSASVQTSSASNPNRIVFAAGFVLLTVSVAAGIVVRFTDRGVPGWKNRTGVARVAERMQQAIVQDGQGGETDFVVRVFGEPALFHHLRTRNVLAFPVGGLGISADENSTNNLRIYLAIGPHAAADPAFQDDFAAHQDRFREVDRIVVRQSDLVL